MGRLSSTAKLCSLLAAARMPSMSLIDVKLWATSLLTLLTLLTLSTLSTLKGREEGAEGRYRQAATTSLRTFSRLTMVTAMC